MAQQESPVSHSVRHLSSSQQLVSTTTLRSTLSHYEGALFVVVTPVLVAVHTAGLFTVHIGVALITPQLFTVY